MATRDCSLPQNLAHASAAASESSETIDDLTRLCMLLFVQANLHSENRLRYTYCVCNFLVCGDATHYLVGQSRRALESKIVAFG